MLQVNRLLVYLAEQVLAAWLLLRSHELIRVFGGIVDQCLVVGAHRGQSRLPQDHEGADPEKEESEERGIKVACVADATSTELDIDLER